MLFLFYEIFGIITNLLGGWLGARWGLESHHECRICCCRLLALVHAAGSDADALSVVWVMAAQALFGYRQRSEQDEREEQPEISGDR